MAVEIPDKGIGKLEIPASERISPSDRLDQTNLIDTLYEWKNQIWGFLIFDKTHNFL